MVRTTLQLDMVVYGPEFTVNLVLNAGAPNSAKKLLSIYLMA